LSQLRGGLIYITIKNNFKVKSIEPTEIKKIITGYGKASKEQVRNALKFFIDEELNGMTNDETDAISVAISAFFI